MDSSSSYVSSEDPEPIDSSGLDSKKKTRGFSEAFAQLVDEKPQKENPILSEARAFETQLKRRRVDELVEKKVIESKKAIREQWHVITDPHLNVELDRMLKKVATRGVVQLFNAIHKQQDTFVEQVHHEKHRLEDKGFEEMSKNHFLSLLNKKGASDEKTSNSSASNMRKKSELGGPDSLLDTYSYTKSRISMGDDKGSKTKASIPWLRDEFGAKKGTKWDENEESDDGGIAELFGEQEIDDIDD